MFMEQNFGPHMEQKWAVWGVREQVSPPAKSILPSLVGMDRRGSDLCRLLRQGGIMEALGSDWVQRKVELIIPAELKPGQGQLVIPVLGTWQTLQREQLRVSPIAAASTGAGRTRGGAKEAHLCKVCCVSCNLVGDDTILNIVLVGKPQVLLRRDVAQEGSTCGQEDFRRDQQDRSASE